MFIYELDQIDFKKLEMDIDGIDHEDYPDFSDAFCYSGSYDGRELTEEEIDYINDSDELDGLIHQRVIEKLF
jgi:hypothetical protein